ncbi:hypothetical protein CLI64_30010 (plasmid) [Nostoc sp. CENA543]|nr:hypothetical protein CLI64_30010 [Nostoc sp. CENA543]
MARSAEQVGESPGTFGLIYPFKILGNWGFGGHPQQAMNASFTAGKSSAERVKAYCLPMPPRVVWGWHEPGGRTRD